MIAISDATPADVELLAELGVRTYLDHHRDLWHPAGLEAYLAVQFDRDKLARDLSGDAVRYFIARDGERAIGFAKLKRDRELPSGDGARGLELEKIYFLRDAAGRGHGGELLGRIFSVALALEQPFVWLDVVKPNAGAIRFYERHGFVRHCEIPFATDKLDVGLWVMRRPTD